MSTNSTYFNIVTLKLRLDHHHTVHSNRMPSPPHNTSSHLHSGLLQLIHQPARLRLRLRQAAVRLRQLRLCPAASLRYLRLCPPASLGYLRLCAGPRLLGLVSERGQLPLGLLSLRLRATGGVGGVLQLLHLLLERVVLPLQAAVDGLELLQLGGRGGTGGLQLDKADLALFQVLLGGAQEGVVFGAESFVLALLLLEFA